MLIFRMEEREMKKMMTALTVATLATVGLVACSTDAESPKTETTTIKVGMVTDAGTIDDKSFNQGTWEGVTRYSTDHPEVKSQYLQPKDATTESFLEAIDNLVLSGNELIITPGFSFEEAIGKAQSLYPDVKFVLIDGQPLVGKDESGNPQYEIGKNTVSIAFSEQEAGFLAGVASALQSQTGKVGFLGGVEVPAVQKLGRGFVAGVAYANAHLGTTTEVSDYLYQGTFTDVDAGKAIAGGMFDKGIDIIFAAAGGVGVGAINEAKSRAENGDDVYMVGVDVDQYDEGLLSDGRSVMLTSAMKYLANAAYQQIDAFVNETFKGGTSHLMNATSNGVGLPEENPNLTEETMTQVQEVFQLIQSGDLVVPQSVEDLDAFLTEMNYSFNRLNY